MYAVVIEASYQDMQYHYSVPQYPKAPISQKVCVTVPPGWDERYGPIDPETGVPETEPNLTMYNWENEKNRSLERILSSFYDAIPEDGGTELEFIIPTVEQATEFVETVENHQPKGYTVDGVFLPPGNYPVHAAIMLHETDTIVGALEDCTFTYVDVAFLPPTPLPKPTQTGIIQRFPDLRVPETISDRTERIAAITIVGILRGVHIGITIVE